MNEREVKLVHRGPQVCHDQLNYCYELSSLNRAILLSSPQGLFQMSSLF